MKSMVLYITPFLSLKDWAAWDFQHVQFPFQQRLAWLRSCPIFSRENIWQKITSNHKKSTTPPALPKIRRKKRARKRDRKESQEAKPLCIAQRKHEGLSSWGGELAQLAHGSDLPQPHSVPTRRGASLGMTPKCSHACCELHVTQVKSHWGQNCSHSPSVFARIVEMDLCPPHRHQFCRAALTQAARLFALLASSALGVKSD